MALLKSVILVV
ncbi:8ec246f9-0c4d-4903-af87-e85fbf3dd2bc [Thermothielavioides terrestris]|uniref:8ec246f9-0c4d-4903-af87-e85fbf3dd2bc n=1 Tax=Thermothielavioides terrestris TaxID=2587410 RepID=A0A446BD61_9PEZI|nr:8ec246f9-0c4d-4903-af87-e85fbf3dd2bc [Thermothielavioides terrestris]